MTVDRLWSFLLLALTLVVVLHTHAACSGSALHVILSVMGVTIVGILATSGWLSKARIRGAVTRDPLPVTSNVNLPSADSSDAALRNYRVQPAISQDNEAPSPGNNDSRRPSDLAQRVHHHTLSSWILGLIQTPRRDTLERATAIDAPRPRSQLWDAPSPPHIQVGYTPQPDRGIYITCLNIPRLPKYPGTKPPGLEHEVENLLIAWSRGIYVNSGGGASGKQVFVRSTLMPTPGDDPMTSLVSTGTAISGDGQILHGAAHYCRHRQLLGPIGGSFEFRSERRPSQTCS